MRSMIQARVNIAIVSSRMEEFSDVAWTDSSVDVFVYNDGIDVVATR